MKQALAVLIFGTCSLLATGCSSSEQVVDVADVPDIVLEAARTAVPGITIVEVVMETTKQGVVYEIEGTTETREYELEIAADGTVLEVEEEDRDD